MDYIQTTERITHKRGTGFLRVILIIIFLVLFSYMLLFLNGKQFLTSTQILAIEAAIVITAFFIALQRSRGIIVDKVSMINPALLFYLVSVGSILMNGGLFSNLKSFFTQSFWFAALLLFCIFIEQNKMFSVDEIFKLLCLAYWFFSVRYYLWIAYDTTAISGSLNCIYYGLLLLPCVHMTKRLSSKIAMISISVINTMLSGKRTAFIILVAAIAIPVLIDFFIGNRKKAFATTLVGVIAFIILYYYIENTYEIVIFDRLSQLEDDGGSGRLTIYQRVLDAFSRLDLAEQILGRGFSAVSRDGMVGTSAHNDFLEVLYDYGIAGLCFYTMFLVRLLKNGVRLYRLKSSLAPTYTATLVAFLCMSLFSHLILYPTYIVFLLLFFSLGSNEIKKHIARENENINLA